MSASGTLNLADYTKVWEDNFATDTQFNYNLFPVAWGYGNDMVFANGALTLTSYASQGWAPIGFMQADTSATTGQGYGLYSSTFSAVAGQGAGICIVMWPANNVWPGAEIDLVEDWADPTRQTGNATIHWAGADGSNQYQTYSFTADMTKPTAVAMDWQPGSLTFYVNGKEVFQYTGAEVPKDAAQGGVNETFGAEVTAAGTAPISSSVSLSLYDMSYSTYNGSTTTTTTTGSTITLSAPGTVQEASVGAGVTVTETVAAPGLATVYEAVFTSANVIEGSWQAVTLNSSGNGSFAAHLEHTGDYVEAVNNTTSPTIKGVSAPVTITDPKPATITLSAPGTVQEASVGAGVTVTETVAAPGLAKVYEAVFTSANVIEGSWQAVTLNSSGNGSFAAHLEHTGDYVEAVNNTTSPTIKGVSAPVTITDPTTTTTTSGGTVGPSKIALTGDNLFTNSGAWTVIGTLSATDSYSVGYAMGADPGGLFSIDGNKLLLNQAMPAGAPASYQVGIIAIDSTGAYAVSNLTVGVNATGTKPATITLSAPGTVQEASVGAGVTVTETVAAPGLATVYEAVFTSANVIEGSWQAVTLNSSGNGSFAAHLEHTGDYVEAVNNTTTPTIKGVSAPVTITDPKPATITLSAPGTVQEASVGAGVTVTETVAAPGLAKVYEAVFTSANVIEGSWQAVTLNSSGNGSFAAHLEHTGDYVEAVNNTTTPTIKGVSAPVTITDPTTTTTTTTSGGTVGPSKIALTGDNLFTNSGAWTVIGTLSATDSYSVGYAMGADPGGLFSIDGNKLLLNQAMPAGAPASYQVGIIAIDSTGAYAVSNLTVGVKSPTVAASSLITAASVQSGATFIGTPHASLTAADGGPVFTAVAGGSDVTFGTGNALVWGTTGADDFIFHAGDGMAGIETFSAAKGDLLSIDTSLRSTMQESVAGGSTTLTLGGATHGIVLQGVTNFNPAAIHWI